MRNLQTAIIGSAVVLALASTPALSIVNTTWSDWASQSDNIATADPTVLAPFNGLTETDKTIALVDADNSVTIQATPVGGAGLTSNKAFPGNTSSGPGGVGPEVTFQEISDTHQVVFDAPGGFDLAGAGAGNAQPGDIFAVQYVINIDTSLYPATDNELVFGTVSLGLNVDTAGGLTAFKRIQGLTPNSVTNGPVQWAANTDFDLGAIFDRTIETSTQTNATVFCGVCTAFLITDYVVIDAGGIGSTVLNSLSNRFEQTVPVPAPLALLGAGLIGIATTRRIAKKHAA
jgi:hypothetical protein